MLVTFGGLQLVGSSKRWESRVRPYSRQRWGFEAIRTACFAIGAGVKNLLAGEQQAAVTVAVEALMDGKQTPESDTYAVFDPKVGGRACRCLKSRWWGICKKASSSFVGRAGAGISQCWRLTSAATTCCVGARGARDAALWPFQGGAGLHDRRRQLPGI